MHKSPLPQLVYNYLFPSPRPTDPNSFAMHLQRNLVPEVRVETQVFYGALDTVEARYPGLDYSHHPHRMRLGRFPWHRRLFRAFDELGLTREEIGSLCRWEGTKWARERYERENGVIVKDTTGDDILPWVEPRRDNPATRPSRHTSGLGSEDDDLEDEEDEEMDEDGEDEEMEEDDQGASDEEVESVGIALNRRLLAAAAAGGQAAGVVMDEEFERWLKEAAEGGNLIDAGVRLGPVPSVFTANPAPASLPPSGPSGAAFAGM